MAERFVTRSKWLASHPPPPERLGQTLAGVALRANAGEDFHYAVREFLDEFAVRGDDRQREDSIAEAPVTTGDQRYDAFLGALAEHLAVVHGLPRPGWALKADRFLDRFWFVSERPGFRAISISQAPGAFRRRNVFIPERSLHRV